MVYKNHLKTKLLSYNETSNEHIIECKNSLLNKNDDVVVSTLLLNQQHQSQEGFSFYSLLIAVFTLVS